MTRNNIILYNPELKTLARNLRKNMTHLEVLLWMKIRRKSLGYQFHREVPILKYIVDFYCHELMIAIEVDRGLHDHPEVVLSDKNRQQELRSFGIQFLRFENKMIKQNIDSVVQIIQDSIKLNS